MKNTALVFLMVMLGFSMTSIFSQEIGYEIKISYNKNQDPPTADIEIKISKGTPGFTFYLMTNDPINGTVLRESPPVEKKSFTFDGVRPGKYFVRIVDQKGMTAGKTVDIVPGNN